jgi:uncharacterized repeat protein (TIGR01451 family)
LDRSKALAIRNRFFGPAIFAAAAIGCAAPAFADATAGGTQIANTASLSFQDGGVARRISSNTVTLGVDVLLDVIVAAEHPTTAPVADAPTPVPFLLTNGGNAQDTFALTGSIDQAGATVVGIAADTDNDGNYSAADAMITTATVTLAPNERRRLFVLVRPVAGGPDSTVSLAAVSNTGNGVAGTVFTGAGIGGVVAVVGHTGARATAHSLLTAQSSAPQLEKSQTVLAPDGSATPWRGAIITYRLNARFPNATNAVELQDAIPAGTVFIAGSITLDGAPLTDGADGDQASFDGAAVHVTLGNVTAAAVRTVTFQARIL